MSSFGEMKNCFCAVKWRDIFISWIVFFAVTVLWQKQDGAFESEFGGHPDEAAHYVTGLMIRDYIAAGFPGNPMTYAKDYYDHYPKVALGNWPPGFYLLQTAWTLVFSPSRVAVMLLMASLTATLAALLFALLKKEFGALQGWIGGGLLVSFPLTQRHTAMVMTEVPIALLAFIALVFFARFLAKEKTADSIFFGLFASAAIMTKGSGMFLGMVPPLAILFTGKWRLLKRPAFWGAAVIVFVLCFPWTWKFRDVARAGWMEGNPSLNFTKTAMVFYPKKLFLSIGFGVGLLALMGLFKARSEVKSNPPIENDSCDIITAVFGSALLALLLFHSIVPAGLEDRHLVPALPLIVFLAMAGVATVSRFLQAKGVSSQISQAVVFGIMVIAFALQTFRNPPKGYQGFVPAAETILAKPENAKSTLLVSSDARGEGMFISELAMREKRPGHVVQRASKVLASSTWSGGNYKLTYKRKTRDGKTDEREYKNEEELAEMLREDSYDLLIVDTSLPNHYRKAHHEMLQKTVEKFPETFERMGDFKIHRENVWTNGIYIYRIKRNARAFQLKL